MPSPLQSLIDSGTKLWLDSVDPDLVKENLALGATGATSNPAIISGLIKTGRFDSRMQELMNQGLNDEAVAWELTDGLVRQAEKVFLPIWEKTAGNDGYVSFELNPLLESTNGPPHDERVAAYVESGKSWSAGHRNRMIKVPATPAGLEACEELSAAGVTLNVTLIFTDRQYQAARDAVWRGAQRRESLEQFKSVYSIFVSRVDVYTDEHASDLSDAAQGMVGIVNAKRIWQTNKDFWAENATPLQQEMIFASTGTKKPDDVAWKYVAAFAGSDIETNPPATNAATNKSGQSFARQVDQLPPASVLAEIDKKIDFAKMEQVLMEQGLQKFVDPQNALLDLIGSKRSELAAT